MFPRLLLPFLCAVLLIGHSRGSHTALTQTHAFHDLAIPHQIANAYTPSSIQTAYDMTPLYDAGLDGTGQTVALIEIDKYSAADLSLFDAAYTLPLPVIREQYVGGHPFHLQHGGETSLDVEWLHALAPGAAIQIYYLNNKEPMATGWHSMATALRLAAASGASIASISLGACGPGTGSAAVSRALKNLFHRGVSVFVSSGDDGDHPGPVKDCGSSIGVTYPGGDPFAVSVGGTSLQLNVDHTISSEVAWKGSGGGRVRSLLPRPFEHAPSVPKDGARWVPDVAYLGDPRTGVNFYHNGHWHRVGGTSLGAPAWAAIWALIRQDADAAGKRVRPAGRLIYRAGNSPSYGSVFHDITLGSNGTYHAGPGWDPVTGWGTPDVAALAAKVVEWSPVR